MWMIESLIIQPVLHVSMLACLMIVAWALNILVTSILSLLVPTQRDTDTSTGEDS